MRSIKARDFTEYLVDKYGESRNAPLLSLAPQVIDLLGVDLENQAALLYKAGESEFPYLNFWKISLTPKRKIIKIDAIPSNAVARKLTLLFNKSGVLTEEMQDIFARATSRPNQYMNLIQRLTQIAKKHPGVYHKDLQAGKNIAFILNAILKGVLFHAYQSEVEIKLTGWGSFSLNNRAKGVRSARSLKTLQFVPVQSAKLES
jgi:nucleoid DNA-binding protein